MKNTNKYGFYSSGYISDRIDRYALRVLNNSYPSTTDELWITSNCSVSFLKELHNTNATYMRTISFEKQNNHATVGVEFVQGKTTIAIGYVTLKKQK
jgi:hypothetical protein